MKSIVYYTRCVTAVCVRTILTIDQLLGIIYFCIIILNSSFIY